MANWNCDACGVMMDADDEGEPELCPRCDQPMVTFTGAALKNLCGGGVTGMQQGSQPASEGSRLPALPELQAAGRPDDRTGPDGPAG